MPISALLKIVCARGQNLLALHLSVLDRFCIFVRTMATTRFAWPRIRCCVIKTWIAWVNNALFAHSWREGIRQLSDFTSCVWTLEGTWSLVGILSGDLLWFALYTCLYGGVVGYEQIANTGPLYTVNVVLTSIDRGVPRPVLRFCSGVFPHEVSANSTFNAGVSYLLWTHGPSKHRRAERQLPHPLPFFGEETIMHKFLFYLI